MGHLDERQLAILVFGSTHLIRSPRLHARTIRTRFGVSPDGFHQELLEALTHPDAATFVPSFATTMYWAEPLEKLPLDLREVLVFESRWRPGPARSKRRAVRHRFGVSRRSYDARLQQAVEHPGAAWEFPYTVARLRRT